MRQIELWANDHIVVRLGRNQYDAARSTRNLVRHLREQAAGRAGVDPSSDTAAANRDRALESAALTRVKREMLEGTLIPAAAVRSRWSDIASGFRQWVLGLPGQIAAKVPTLNPQDRREIDLLCHDGLSDMALGRGFDFRAGDPSDVLSDRPVDDASAGAVAPAAADQAVGVDGS